MHQPLNADVARLIDARIAIDVERRRAIALAPEGREAHTPLGWLVERLTGRPSALLSRG